MPIHFDPGEFEHNFPTSADVFPTAEDNEDFIDAILFNSLMASIDAIEGYLILWKENIEMESMESFEGSEGLLSFPVPAGRYASGKTATAQDSDLVQGNIKKDVVIFGVTGTLVASQAGLIGITAPANDVISETPVNMNSITLTLTGKIPSIGIPTVTSP